MAASRIDHVKTPSAHGRGGFTLLKLLAVLGIVVVAVALLLPALLRARHASQRHRCDENVRRQAEGLIAFAAAQGSFPPGADAMPAEPDLPHGTGHAWSTFILPYVEQARLADRIDLAKGWNAPGGNDEASDATVPLYVCPSGLVSYPGKTDFGGISGTTIVGAATTGAASDMFASGILIRIDTRHPERITIPMVTDGLANTLLVGESADRGRPPGPDVDLDTNCRWAFGTNCFSQNAEFVNDFDQDNIRSRHQGGAHVGFADGRTAFLADTLDPPVLGALCTRSGGEPPAPEPTR